MTETTTPARANFPAEKESASLRVRKCGEPCVTITSSSICLNRVRVSHQEMVVLRKIAARIKGVTA
ncbi:hypothetical protein [Burkholderia ubonensis]|uniref:hypothetical protein n=1 Tax=Burkholderia ubonensis TaxID=101571 RepID=UPI000AD3344B|nr:hypothetical protein [Burkholderia ubonensis]